jgi:hypothetical protein
MHKGSEDSQFPHQHLNPGPPEGKTGGLFFSQLGHVVNATHVNHKLVANITAYQKSM